MRFITASVLSLCVTATLAAPSRISRRSTMNGSQKTLGDTVKSDQVDRPDRSRVFVDIPLTLAEVTSAEVGAPASSVRFYRTLDLENDQGEMIRIPVDLKSLRTARKDQDCDFAFRKEKKPDVDYIYYDSEERLAVFTREDTGLWSVRCSCMGAYRSEDETSVDYKVPSISMPENTDEVEVPEEEPIFRPEDVEGIPDFKEEEPKEVTEVLEETTEVTTETVTKVTTKVTTEFTRKNSANEDAEAAAEHTYEEIVELESATKRSIDSEEYDSDDMKRQRGITVNEFDIEII
ncbi:hypothetical protein TWF506_006102 [Arthrobotrys conoides]|uniref:Uncharacterized protein n=1 Tax=Arthrobotrys conoides TaxID=74498 RepID=A0AAN8NG94_9PEZI